MPTNLSNPLGLDPHDLTGGRVEDSRQSRGMLKDAPKPLRALYSLVFPNGVRVWHFILIPALGMGLALGFFRVVDGLVLPGLGPAGGEIYYTSRTVLISLLMASIIAFLAIQYRTGYEAQLQAHNDTLEATRDFLTRIIEGSADAIITRDSEGRITAWNPAAEAIFGWSASEVHGLTADRLLRQRAQSRAQFALLNAELKDGRTMRDIEASAVRKDLKEVTVSITAAPLYDASGRFAGSTALVRDVTALKEMERQLLERERLAAVGELAAMVAHEVRNPLAGIRGGCEILLEGYPKGDPRNEIGVEVIHQVDRLNRMVQELLMFARPKATDRVPTDLHALVDRAFSILQEDPENVRVELRRDFGTDVPVVLVDGRQWEQVILNLVLNAIQVMQHRGSVTVSTRRTPRGVTMAVQDSGPGIPADRLPQIFKPFFTTRAQGTGLGLAIVKKIVEAHGGTIEAANHPGGGAVFTATLPIEA